METSVVTDRVFSKSGEVRVGKTRSFYRYSVPTFNTITIYNRRTFLIHYTHFRGLVPDHASSVRYLHKQYLWVVGGVVSGKVSVRGVVSCVSHTILLEKCLSYGGLSSLHLKRETQWSRVVSHLSLINGSLT